MHLKDSGNRPGRMTGHQVYGDSSAAERDLHAVGGDNVTLGLAVRKTIDGLVDHIPIARSHDNMRTIAFLHQFRAADFVLMGMGNNDVFHPGGIEAKLFQAADNDRLRVIHALCVVQNDSVTGGQSPSRTGRRAHPIQVVKSLFRLEVCACPIGVHRRRWSVWPRSAVQRRDADCGDQAVEIRAVVAAPRGVLARRKMSFDRVRCRPHSLRIGSAYEGQDGQRASNIPFPF